MTDASRCSFCGRPEDQVHRLVVGPDFLICDECASVAKDLAGSPSAPPKPVAVIPARWASTRFPGKVLAPLLGKPMIQHVHRRCVESGAFSQVLVATDDDRVVKAVEAFGGQVVRTSSACESGTDRVAEVARHLERFSGRSGPPDLECTPDRLVFVNVQADEPAIHPESLASLTRAFEDPKVEMATLVRPLAKEERTDPDVVKAVVGADGCALYFSRADVPHSRSDAPIQRWAHLGIYGYRWTTLLTLSSLPKSPLEQAEGLEQLRALENGIRIACRPTAHANAAVDRPDDLEKAERLLRERGWA